jgi:hypothetical protein
MVERIHSSDLYKQALNNGMPKGSGKDFYEKYYKLARELCKNLEINFGDEENFLL